MTERHKAHFYSEWELKAHIHQGEPDPRSRVSAMFCLVHAEQTAGWWRLEFVDQAFAHNFPCAQHAFQAMTKAQRRRFIVTVTFRDVEDKWFAIGMCYLIEDLIGLEVCPLGGIYGYSKKCPRFVYNRAPDAYPY